MAVVQTKYVTVGSTSFGSITLRGFYTGGLNFGTISNTSGGSSATNLYSVSAQTTVESINHSSYGSGALVFTLKGNYAVPSNAGFDTLKIAGNSFSRTAATSTTNTSNKTRTWTWSGASNPFGSVNNAVKTVTWETTTATYSVTAPTSINEGSTGTINVATTNVANSTTLYYTVQGIPFNTNNASPSDFGVSSYPSGSFSISSNAGSFTLTVTADLTTEGQEAAQVDIRTGSTSGTVVATDTFNIIDTSTTPASDTTPNAFSFTDKTGNVSTEQNSSVQITGINAATTVSRTSGTATFAVVGTSTTPSTSNFGTSNTTITNNQYLHVKQTTSSSYSTSLSTVMNVGGVTDTWTTTSNAAPSITAPTASSVTFDNPASANTTATVNLSASGSGGTLEYACEVGDSTPDNWQSGSTFTISRGSGTVYARARRSSTTNSNTVNATRPGFLTGDPTVNASSSTIGHGATSASTTLSNATAGETYAVRVNNGSTNLATRTGNGALSFTSSLPSAGNTSTYEIFVRRPTSTGGDGSTYTATNDTFTITRSSVNNPNQFTFADETSIERNIQKTSNLITIAGLTSGTSVSVSITGGTYSKNSGSYATANTTATNGDTFKVRHLSSSAVSTAVNTTLTVAGISDTYTTTTTSSYCPTTNTAHTITGITTTSTGTLSQTSIVSSNNSLICSLTTPYAWQSGFNPSSTAIRSNITSVSVTTGGGSVSLSRTNNSTAHTITYTPPATSTETTAVVQIQHRKQDTYYDGDSGNYFWSSGGALTTVNITVTICPVSQTTVSITNVDSVTPAENSTDVVTATPVTASGVTISSYAWTTTNSNVISLSSTTAQSPTLTFGNVTQNTVVTIGVTVTDSTGATATASQSYSVQFVNQAPVAILNGPGTVTVSTAASMDASDSYDNDGQSLTYQFTATNGGQSFSSGTASSTDTWSFTPTDSNSSYTVTLTVSDGVTTSTATKSVLSVNNASETTTGAGGFGFEVLNASGGTILRGDELLIRKAKVVTANGSGAASTTVTGTEAGTRIIGMTAGEANTGVEISVTGTTTKTVTLSNALANEKIFLYLLR